ncbi:hypothetical protein D3C87_1391940 [compost metagenome]
MAHLERWRVVQRGSLPRDGIDDFLAAMAGGHAPEAGTAVQDLAAVVGGVVHAAGRGQQARGGLVLAIGGERHPQGIHIGDHGLGGVHTFSSESGCGGRGAKRPGTDSGNSTGAVGPHEYTVGRSLPYRTV